MQICGFLLRARILISFGKCIKKNRSFEASAFRVKIIKVRLWGNFYFVFFKMSIYNFLFCLIKKETKKSSLALPHRSNKFSNTKRKELATLKQLFFLRIFQTFDARLRKLRTVVSSENPFLTESSRYCFTIFLRVNFRRMSLY